MTELKTLKDLEYDMYDAQDEMHCVASPVELLREEAIKWVKEFRHQTGRTSLGNFGKNTCAGVCYGLIQFFNLIEEDLK